jgi:hypothetical protein
MEQPPPIPLASRNNDLFIRCTLAVVIGVVGFWWPVWYEWHLPENSDSRLGVVFIFTLPIILAAAIWASVSFRGAHGFRYLFRGLLLIVWSPIILAAFTAARIIVHLIF